MAKLALTGPGQKSPALRSGHRTECGVHSGDGLEQEIVATGCTRNDEKEKEQSSQTHNPGPLQTGLSQNTCQIRTETEME